MMATSKPTSNKNFERKTGLEPAYSCLEDRGTTFVPLALKFWGNRHHCFAANLTAASMDLQVIPPKKLFSNELISFKRIIS